MINLKKRGPIRQYSLQYNSPKTHERKLSLKKQYSEDLTDNISSSQDIETCSSIRVSLSAKRTNPPQIKLAWSENTQQNKTKEITQQKPFIESKQLKSSLTPNKIVKQPLDKTENKTETKQNLSIFLGPNVKDIKDDDLSDSSYSSTDNQIRNRQGNPNSTGPKFILPLNPEIANANAENMKSVFQKHIRKVTKQKSLFADNYYSPTRAENCSTIVVPVITSKTPGNSPKEQKLQRQSSLDIDTSRRKDTSETTDSSRPSTTASQREMFQKRTSSASSISKGKKDSSFRPPLVRASSVPLKQEPQKPKFVATKRRVKTAKAKVRIGKEEHGFGDDDDTNGNKKYALKRCISVNGCEVETMVSLLTPSGSENEEDLQEEKEKEKVVEQTTKISCVENEVQQVGEHRSFSLRKTVKSVSFQQSTIHAIRSFSASFPERRKSVATALFLNHSTPSQLVQKIQEKRAPVNTIDDEERVPKRRLIRTKSAPLHRSHGEDSPTKSPTNSSEEIANLDATSKDLTQPTVDEETPSVSTPFENAKERQCWDMYRKLNEKGLSISFDTILRGMLTPTEYRLRSKTSPAAPHEDNCEIAES